MPRRLPERSRRFELTHCALHALVTLGIGLTLADSATASALAHVEIDVGDGQYVMEVGFRDEPAYLGLPNALALGVERYATGGTEPVNDLAATTEARIAEWGKWRPSAVAKRLGPTAVLLDRLLTRDGRPFDDADVEPHCHRPVPP